MSSQKPWNVAAAKRHYAVSAWGMDHFDINDQGNVVIKISNTELDLYTLSQALKNQNISLPTLVRFPQILQQSLHDLSSAFEQAMQVNHYSGKYIAAYPIKVNQQATVIQHFQQQNQWPVAFEVGSKAELIACYGTAQHTQTIICNGYKDESYIRLALLGNLLGHEVVIVLENLNELKFVVKHCAQLGVQAHLGMRVRLSLIAKGNWQNTGGEHSKFGLTSSEVLELVSALKQNQILAWMKMLHFHMGSQIPCLRDIQSGITEAMHYFQQLAQQDVEFQQLNIGGGLAVDYEGSQSERYFSMDYSLQEYADVIVKTIKECCEIHSLSMPNIFSESGRAMTAYHAVLLTDVIDVESQYVNSDSECEALLSSETSNTNLNSLIEKINEFKISLQDHEDLQYFTKDYLSLEKLIKTIEKDFSLGKLSLIDKALVEKLAIYSYRLILNRSDMLSKDQRLDLEDKLVAKYFCNFSLFQSTPDVWGLQQIFPIMPLHRLSERPTIRTRIYDLTCDSDGRIDQYVQGGGVQPYLSLHECLPEQDYVLGIFLVGAYQEVLGDMHNLFGDTNAVNILINEDGSYQICDEEPGDTVEEILSYLHINTHSMRQLWLDKLSHRKMSDKSKQRVLKELETSLRANSYLV